MIKILKEELIKKHEKERPDLVEGLTSLDIKGIANYIKKGYAKKILILTGAGISVASGIPDFRSPKTGIYSNLQKYNLSKPELLFTRFFFNLNPKPFYEHCKDFLLKEYKPSIAHYLSVLFERHNMLSKYYTQNIDGLDKKAGLSDEKLIECHGKFRTSSCLKCNKKYDTNEIKDDILNDKIPKCKYCDGIIQPDVVFYGDDLPDEFFEQLDKDFQNCDLLIVIGSSLKVEPFPGMIEDPPKNAPRVLINNVPVATYDEELEEFNGKLRETGTEWLTQKFKFGHFFNKRDIYLGGDLQENVLELIREIGWEEELNELKNKN